ncbi:MAG: cob(I)yrinic acid a,c-diamide adenosyltransferase [Ignavibacteriaceae bacterium]|nr:cob(I)yrinic acid a,c-diamide adenosyltransferase [Ignavibacteriaceae bacterium]
MKIYTKTGDKGETGLFGGQRVSKNNIRIEAYGTVDELNSFIGYAITEITDIEVKRILLRIQDQLFIVGSDLATPNSPRNERLKIERTPLSFSEEIENAIDQFELKLEPLNQFILPGGSKSASLLQICRTITRRAERRVVELNSVVNIGENILIFLNRLSDLFFVLSRYENKVAGVPDIKWNSKS